MMKNLKMILGIAVVPFFVFCLGCGGKPVAENSSGRDSAKAIDSSFSKADSSLNLIDANGKRQGFWTITGAMAGNAAYQPNAIVAQGYYTDNQQNGKWISVNPDGSVKKISFYKNGVLDSVQEKNPAPTLKNFVDANGKRQGFWEITGAMAKDPHYRPDAIVESGKYVDDEKDGLWTTYNPDGSAKKIISIKLRGR